MEPQVFKGHYFRKKYSDLNRFISYYYQVDLTSALNPKKILEIGKGSGVFSDYMKKLGYAVTTCDFDKSLEPDRVADIRALPFGDGAFDAVTAFEVLEHLPWEDVPGALRELYRVTSQHALISIPYRSTGIEAAIKFPGIRTLFKRPFVDIFFRFPLRFGGIKTSGQHYWEIDRSNYSPKKLRVLLNRYFVIKAELRPPLNYYHYFFVLEKHRQ